MSDAWFPENEREKNKMAKTSTNGDTIAVESGERTKVWRGRGKWQRNQNVGCQSMRKMKERVKSEG